MKELRSRHGDAKVIGLLGRGVEDDVASLRKLILSLSDRLSKLESSVEEKTENLEKALAELSDEVAALNMSMKWFMHVAPDFMNMTSGHSQPMTKPPATRSTVKTESFVTGSAQVTRPDLHQYRSQPIASHNRNRYVDTHHQQLPH